MLPGEIISLFSNTFGHKGHVSASEISDMSKYVKPEMCISENGMGYMWRISVMEMIKRGIPDEVLSSMADRGWSLSNDRKFIEFPF